MWINFNVSFSTRSEVALQIYDAIKEAGYDVPVPLQKIHYTSDEKDKGGDLPYLDKRE
jgi:small-conductance mechanosensitive channel